MRIHNFDDAAGGSAAFTAVMAPEPPQVVISAHPPLFAEVLARAFPVQPDGERPVHVIPTGDEPDADAVHVLRLPEVMGDPAVLDSPGHSTWLVLPTLDDVTELVRALLHR